MLLFLALSICKSHFCFHRHRRVAVKSKLNSMVLFFHAGDYYGFDLMVNHHETTTWDLPGEVAPYHFVGI